MMMMTTTYCKYAVEYDDQPSNEVDAAPTVHCGYLCATLTAVLRSSTARQQLVNTQDPK